MIRYLEISARRSGKTRRLVQRARDLIISSRNNIKIGFMAHTEFSLVQNVMSHFSDRECREGTVIFFTNYNTVRGLKFDAIFIDEFDFISSRNFEHIITLYTAENIDLYLATTPSFVRTPQQMAIHTDNIVWALNHNDVGLLHKYTNGELGDNFALSEKGIYVQTSERVPDAETFISGVLNIEIESIGTASFNDIGIVSTHQPLYMNSNNQIQEMIENEVQRRLEEIKKQQLSNTRTSNIGSDLGKREIEA